MRIIEQISSIKIIAIGISFVLIVIPFLMPDSFLLNAFIMYFIYITLAVSWNLVGGYAGLLNLGHGAFFGLGAYFYAFLAIHGLNQLLCIPIGALGAIFLAVIMVPTFRLRGDYFAIGTLALPTIMKIFFERILGISSVLHLPEAESYNIFSFYFPSLVIVLLVILIQIVVVKSNFGMVLRSIGNDEITASSIGIYTVKYKLYALIISAYFAGLAGGFYTYNAGYILPEFVFSSNWSLIPLFMCLLGGRGSLMGPIIGAVVYVVISHILTFTLSQSGFTLLIFGAIILFVALFAPRGLGPHISSYVKRVFNEKG